MTENSKEWSAKRILAINTLLWITLWLLSLLNGYQWSVSEGRPFAWNAIFSWTLPYYWLMILFGPVLYALYMKWHSFSYTRQVLYHFLPAVLMGFIHQLVLSVFSELINASAESTLSLWQKVGARYESGFWFSANGFLFYWLSVGLFLLLHLYQQYQLQRLANLKLTAQFQEAKLAALQMQLQPHFLFNAFNSIAMMARQRHYKEVIGMINALSELLRMSLSIKDDQRVPLSVELELVQKYLQVVQIRFRDKLTVKLEIPTALENYLVPSLVLQPIIENAFQHGISKNEGDSYLRLAAEAFEKQIRITVFNNGPLLHEDMEWGLGLSNIQDRLEQLYAGSATLEIINQAEPAGVLVQLRLPREPAEGVRL